MAKRRRKQFHLRWVFEPFIEHPTYAERSMFGGLAVYCHGRMVLVLMEDPSDFSYRGVTYDFPIWNGVLLPTERNYHESLQKDFPALLNHPVLPKWLYLPQTHPDFESLALALSASIAANDERCGIYPKEPRKRKRRPRSSSGRGD